MRNVWLSSDTHFGHRNIVRGCSDWTDKEACRNFETVEEMNQVLVDNINSVVKAGDTLYHLGDWSMGGIDNIKIFRDRLICQDIHLFLGNHDEKISRNATIKSHTGPGGIVSYIHSKSLFSTVRESGMISINGQQIYLGHYAMKIWENSHKGSWNLYGHSHGSLPDDPNSLSMDVGVDTNFMMPYSFDEIKYYMNKKVWSPVDHHNIETT